MENNIETPFNKNTNIFFKIKIIVIIIKKMKKSIFIITPNYNPHDIIIIKFQIILNKI